MFTRIYILTCPQLPGRFKIGISRDVYARMGRIAEELAQSMCRDVTINKELSAPILFPESVERFSHRLFSGLRTQVPYHAGYTEWFRSRNFFAALAFLLFLHFTGAGLSLSRIAIVAVLYFARYPLDGILAVGSLFLLQFAAVGALMYSLLSLL